jgi:hypothetical protein
MKSSGYDIGYRIFEQEPAAPVVKAIIPTVGRRVGNRPGQHLRLPGIKLIDFAGCEFYLYILV